MTTITVRDVDADAFHEFKTAAVERKMKVGVALTLAMEKFRSDLLPKHKKFTMLKPRDLGIGTERLSQDVDKIMYEE